MEVLVNKVLSTIARKRLDDASSQLDLRAITELLARNPHTDFRMQNSDGLPGFADIEGFLRSVMRLQLFRLQHAANLFRDEQTNVIRLYSEAFASLNRSEALMNSARFFQALIVQCKQDMKVYWRLPVQTLDSQIQTIINELRELFKTYKSNQLAKGVLLSVNNLFWFYFHINEFQQCTYFVRPFKDQIDSLLEGIEKSFTVTFYYYYGKMKIYEGEKERAVEYLEKALGLCHSRHRSHKVKILRLLVPFKMLCGYLPREAFLKEYGIEEYADIVLAIKTGDVELFEKSKQRNRRFWIKTGIYFIIDSLELLLIRRLFKIVWLLSGKNSIIPTESLQRALNRKSQYKFDILETECLIGNLILKGYMRACVYPEQKKTVFAPDNTFPALIAPKTGSN